MLGIVALCSFDSLKNESSSSLFHFSPGHFDAFPHRCRDTDDQNIKCRFFLRSKRSGPRHPDCGAADGGRREPDESVRRTLLSNTVYHISRYQVSNIKNSNIEVANMSEYHIPGV